jgi:hypothetical protein
MNNQFTLNSRAIYRTVCVMLAALLVVAGVPFFQNKHAEAAQLQLRSIQLSDSGSSGNSAVPTGIGSGTGVTYRVSFTALAGAGSMVIDFCMGTPIINDACTAPTGMVATGATLNANQASSFGLTGQVYTGNGWTTSATATQIKLADTTAGQNITASPQVFELSNITNPSSITTGSGTTPVGTFYARIYTYQGNSYGAYASPTNVANSQSPATGGVVDYGGIALSTANTITITARVQETLTFCVTKADPTTWTTSHDCSDPVVGNATNYPALTLGHNSGTGALTLDPTVVDTAIIWTQLSTNANSGAVVNLRNSNNTCGGLSADNNTTCAIPAVPDGNGATPGYQAGPITAGTARFGVFADNSVNDLNPAGTLTPTPAYHDNAHQTFPTDVYYGMDTTTADGAGLIPKTTAGSVKSTFGSTVASTSAPLSHIDMRYIFAAAASLTTPAGIYTANLSMVATGTF